MFKKEKVKKTLRLNLLLMDIIAILAIFVGIIFVFEFLIKDMLVRNNVDKFVENIKISQFDLLTSLNYINNKSELPYEESINDVFDYLKLSVLKRSKFDNSLFLAVFPKEQNKIIAGIRKNLSINYNSKEDLYNFFKNKIEELSKNKSSRKSNINYITFNFQSRSYLGTAEFANSGIRNNFKRESSDLIYPIIVVADRNDEFFFIINRIRNIFLILLAIVFGIIGYIKIKNTIIAVREIKATSDGITDISNEIKNNGIVKSEISKMEAKFQETSNLDNSFTSLVKSLVSVGDIISGIADRDLFIATLKNDNSLLKPHDEMMAVLFLDIQSFTTIAEKHKNNIMTIVNSLWKNVEKIIGEKKAKINKYMGDACLIIFRDKDNKSANSTSYNAFCSAIELLEQVPVICKDLDISFNFRIGLDYGKVTYGKTGTDDNYELGVIGDAVNTASRLEALNKQYHTNFLITDTAFNSAGFKRNEDVIIISDNKDFTLKCFRIDKARPKGKKEAKELFTVLKIKGKNQYSFVGSDKSFNSEALEHYEKLINTFLDSIKYWQKYSETKKDALKTEAEKSWISLAKSMADFYHKTKFPPVENFIKSLVKFEEYDEFISDPENWLKKKSYNIKEPSQEWITLGTNELEK